jgi:hypothetical protein
VVEALNVPVRSITGTKVSNDHIYSPDVLETTIVSWLCSLRSKVEVLSGCPIKFPMSFQPHTRVNADNARRGRARTQILETTNLDVRVGNP